MSVRLGRDGHGESTKMKELLYEKIIRQDFFEKNHWKKSYNLKNLNSANRAKMCLCPYFLLIYILYSTSFDYFSPPWPWPFRPKFVQHSFVSRRKFVGHSFPSLDHPPLIIYEGWSRDGKKCWTNVEFRTIPWPSRPTFIFTVATLFFLHSFSLWHRTDTVSVSWTVVWTVWSRFSIVFDRLGSFT